MVSFTPSESALIEEWIEGEDLEILELQQARGFVRSELVRVETEHSIYTKMRAEALAQLNVLLVAKADALFLADLEEERTVTYLPEHPQNGEADITAWKITYLFSQPEPPLEILTTEYSHTVNWDDNPEILAVEAEWVFWNQLIVSEFFGSQFRLDGLTSAVTQLTNQIAVFKQRNDKLEVIVNA